MFRLAYAQRRYAECPVSNFTYQYSAVSLYSCTDSNRENKKYNFNFRRDGGSCQPNRKDIFYTAARRQHTGNDKNRGLPAALHRKAKGFVDVIVIWATY